DLNPHESSDIPCTRQSLEAEARSAGSVRRMRQEELPEERLPPSREDLGRCSPGLFLFDPLDHLPNQAVRECELGCQTYLCRDLRRGLPNPAFRENPFEGVIGRGLERDEAL